MGETMPGLGLTLKSESSARLFRGVRRGLFDGGSSVSAASALPNLRISQACASSIRVKAEGTKTRLKTVDVRRPPITDMPIGARNSALAPMPSATGSIPAVMATVVMMIGRARLRAAMTKASWRLRPRLSREMIAYSTSRIEFFAAMPINMMRPINDVIDSELPVIASAPKAPPSERGRAVRIVNG